MSSTEPSFWTPRLAQALRRLLTVLRRPLRPRLLAAMLHQAHRLRTVHQVAELQRLGACWLAGPERRALDQALHQRLQQMAEQPPSPRNTSSSGKTGRRTTKRRR